MEILGNDVAGLAVHIGAPISSLAGASEILVSRTVRDLVTGSGFDFDDRGTHPLKGVPTNGRYTRSSSELGIKSSRDPSAGKVLGEEPGKKGD